MYAVKFENVCKIFGLHEVSSESWRVGKPPEIGSGVVHALSDVSFQVKKGECVGIIGENGSGKTTLLKIVAGILSPTSGRVSVKGQYLPLIELGVSFQQDMTGKENVEFYGTLMGVSDEIIKQKLPEIQRFAEIGDFFDLPLTKYSAGMEARLMFSAAFMVEPEILLIDEIFAVGDIDFQRKSIRKILEIKERGAAILFVSHNMFQIKNLCNRAILLQHGKIVQEGEPEKVTSYYLDLMFEKTRDDLVKHFHSTQAHIEATEKRLKSLDLEIDKEKKKRGIVMKKLRTSLLKKEKKILEDTLSFDHAEIIEIAKEACTLSSYGTDIFETGSIVCDLNTVFSGITDIFSYVTKSHFLPPALRRTASNELCGILQGRFVISLLEGTVEEQTKLARDLIDSLNINLSLYAPGEPAWIESFKNLGGVYFHIPLGNANPSAPYSYHLKTFKEMLGFFTEKVLPLSQRFLRKEMAREFEEVVTTRIFSSTDYSDAIRVQVEVFSRLMENIGDFSVIGFVKLRPEEISKTIIQNIMAQLHSLEVKVAEYPPGPEIPKKIEELKNWLKTMNLKTTFRPRGGSFTITSVWFEDQRDIPQTEFSCGESFAIVIEYFARQKIEKPMFGIGIYTSQGTLITGPNTTFAGRTPPEVKGKGVIKFKAKNLPLNPGLYLVSVSACSYSGAQCYDYHDRSYSFRVKGKTKKAKTILRIPVKWSFKANS